MIIEPGITVLHYRIVDKIGEGGMGAVFLAEDTKLDRKVALKILPPAMAADAGRLDRFQREAKVVAALNHPNIVTLHSVEQVGDTHFLTMEWVEGDSLDHAVAPGGLPLARVLDVGIAMADALAAAHDKGIIHRDLKPANVMVTRDGRVKVLDFGLAKLTLSPDGRPIEDGADIAATATVVSPGKQSLTDAGLVLGTVPYMSPEQVNGQPVDTRTDVFALGIVLYEMATGRRPFSGATQAETMSSILRDVPRPVIELRQDLPRHLGRIVRRCLAKDPARRYQSTLDLRNDLQELKAEIESGELPLGETTGVGVVAEMRSGRRGLMPWAGVAAVVALLAVAGVLVLSQLGRQEPAPGSARGQAMEMVRLTTTGKASDAAISGDGRYMAHVVRDRGQSSLLVTQVSTSSSVEIVPATTGRLSDPTFSPGGEYVFYIYRDPTASSPGWSLFRVPVLGGASKRLLDGVFSGVSFSPDGQQIAYQRKADTGIEGEEQLVIAGSDGRDVRVLASRKYPELFTGAPSWSPDGRVIAIAFISYPEIAGGLLEVSVSSGKERRLTGGRLKFVSDPVWLPDGSGLVFQGTEDLITEHLWELDHVSGDLRRITRDVNTYDGVSVTADGKTLATIVQNGDFNLWSVPVDGASPLALTRDVGVGNYAGAWTEDGRIFYQSDKGGSIRIWSMDDSGVNAAPLTDEAIYHFEPHATPDGKTIVTGRFDDGTSIWRMDRDGSNARRITSGGVHVDPQISPDGKWITCLELPSFRVLRFSTDGGTPEPLVEERAENPRISPDGKYVAYRATDPETKKRQTFIVPMEGGEATGPMDIPSDEHRWTPDGTGIAYVVEGDGVDNIWSRTLDGGPPTQRTHFTTGEIANFIWSPDGEHLLVTRGRRTSDVVLLKNFRE